MGSVMLAAAAALVIIDATLLPVSGFILTVPVAALAIYIFRLHLNDQCEIDFTDQQPSAIDHIRYLKGFLSPFVEMGYQYYSLLTP